MKNVHVGILHSKIFRTNLNEAFTRFIKIFISLICIKETRWFMFLRRKKFSKISNSVIFLSLILLAGIIIMAYGVFNNFHLTLYIGLAITVSGSIYGTYWLTILRRVASK